MPDLTFYGASDDLVEVEGVFVEEYPVPTQEATFLVVAPDGRQVRVLVIYDGCWSVTYAPVDENIEGLDGTVTVDRYTARLTLDVPEKTKVHKMQ